MRRCSCGVPGGPLRLFAETVRENSARYRRPLPLGAFEQPPFCVTRQEIVACLQAMTTDDVCQGIARTCTSAGNACRCSIAHLNADQAASLAEWIDMGQHEDPWRVRATSSDIYSIMVVP